MDPPDDSITSSHRHAGPHNIQGTPPSSTVDDDSVAPQATPTTSDAAVTNHDGDNVSLHGVTHPTEDSEIPATDTSSTSETPPSVSLLEQDGGTSFSVSPLSPEVMTSTPVSSPLQDTSVVGTLEPLQSVSLPPLMPFNTSDQDVLDIAVTPDASFHDTSVCVAQDALDIETTPHVSFHDASVIPHDSSAEQSTPYQDHTPTANTSAALQDEDVLDMDESHAPTTHSPSTTPSTNTSTADPSPADVSTLPGLLCPVTICGTRSANIPFSDVSTLCHHINEKHRKLSKKLRTKISQQHPEILFCRACNVCLSDLKHHFCEKLGEDWNPNSQNIPWDFLRGIPDHEVVGRHTVLTSRYVPKQARSAYTRVFHTLATNASREHPASSKASQADYFKLFLLFQTWMLQATNTEGHRKLYDTRRALTLFFSNRWQELHQPPPPPQPRSSSVETEHLHRLAHFHVSMGQLSDGFRALSRTSHSHMCDTPLSTLQSLLQCGGEVDLPLADTDHPQLAASLCDNNVAKALEKAKKGRAPGPFGMTSDTWTAHRQNLSNSLAKLGSALLQGKMPDVCYGKGPPVGVLRSMHPPSKGRLWRKLPANHHPSHAIQGRYLVVPWPKWRTPKPQCSPTCPNSMDWVDTMVRA